MGIKDNFSQAVKELWKKDGQDKDDNKSDGSTELDKYLRQDNEPQKVGSGSGVPLETPYYRDPVPAPEQNTTNTASAQSTVPERESTPPPAQNQGFTQTSNAAPAQNMQNMGNPINSSPAGNPDQGGINQNVQNIRNNFGQNNENSQSAPNNQDSVNVGYNSGIGYDQGGYNQNAYNQGGYNQNAYNQGGGYGGGGGYVPPNGGGAPAPMQAPNETDELTVVSKNTVIDGNVHSLANMRIDGNIKGNVETTRNVDMSGKIVGDITCNNAAMNSAAMQGNVSLKGRMRMDRDTILIGDLSSQYADINGRIRGKLDIVGKAELKRDAIVFGDINASTIAVTDGAIIQGYVNTTFLSKEDSRNVFPEAISFDNKEANSPK